MNRKHPCWLTECKYRVSTEKRIKDGKDTEKRPMYAWLESQKWRRDRGISDVGRDNGSHFPKNDERHQATYSRSVMRLKRNLITVKPATPRHIMLRLLKSRENLQAERLPRYIIFRGVTLLLVAAFSIKIMGARKHWMN